MLSLTNMKISTGQLAVMLAVSNNFCQHLGGLNHNCLSKIQISWVLQVSLFTIRTASADFLFCSDAREVKYRVTGGDYRGTEKSPSMFGCSIVWALLTVSSELSPLWISWLSGSLGDDVQEDLSFWHCVYTIRVCDHHEIYDFSVCVAGSYLGSRNLHFQQ